MKSNIYRLVVEDHTAFENYVVQSVRGGADIVTTSRSVAGATARVEDDIFFRRLETFEVAGYEGDSAVIEDIKARSADVQPTGVIGTLMMFGDPPDGGYFALDAQGKMVGDAFLTREEVIALMPNPRTP